MFDEQQINSYQSITAPANLKAKVMTACEDTKTAKRFSVPSYTYKLVPLAACLLLFFSVMALNRSEPLTLHAGDLQLGDYSVQLPAESEASVSVARAYSLEPAQYTVTLTGNQSMEILSADGFAALNEDGSITWTIDVPTNDMVYELFLLAEDETYYVPLRYTAAADSFSISYEAQ